MPPSWRGDNLRTAFHFGQSLQAGDPPPRVPRPFLHGGSKRPSPLAQEQEGALVAFEWVVDGKFVEHQVQNAFPWPAPLAIEGNAAFIDLATAILPSSVAVRIVPGIDAEGRPEVAAHEEECGLDRSRSRCRIVRPRDAENWQVVMSLPPAGGNSYISLQAFWVLHPGSTLRQFSPAFMFHAAWLFAIERPVVSGWRLWLPGIRDAREHPAARIPEEVTVSPQAARPRALRGVDATPSTMSLAGRVDALCFSPVGSAFLLGVEATRLSAAEAADPVIATHAAAIALSEIDLWDADVVAIVAEALRHGPRLRGLAEQILSQPAAGHWFAPLDREAQWAVEDPGEEITPDSISTPTSPPDAWELYAQKPADVVYTSTVVGNTCSVLAAMEHGAGDIYARGPIARVRLVASDLARVYEVTGPLDWHQLAVRYPAQDEHGRLVPDWGRFAADWDAVHLTLGGLLTATYVGVESAAGWSELQGWDAEMTAWVRWQFATLQALPVLDRPPRPPIELERAGLVFQIARKSTGRRFARFSRQGEAPNSVVEPDEGSPPSAHRWRRPFARHRR